MYSLNFHAHPLRVGTVIFPFLHIKKQKGREVLCFAYGHGDRKCLGLCRNLGSLSPLRRLFNTGLCCHLVLEEYKGCASCLL